MKEWNVTFKIFNNDGTKFNKTIKSEGGTKKSATIRAMAAINKIDEYKGLFKEVVSVEEIK